MEVAVAGVLDAGGRLDGEEAGAFQGKVERVAGLLQRALRKIGARRAENSEGTDGAGGDVGRGGHHLGFEADAFAAESGGVGVGEIVGGEIELLGACEKTGAGRVDAVVHSKTPL